MEKIMTNKWLIQKKTIGFAAVAGALLFINGEVQAVTPDNTSLELETVDTASSVIDTSTIHFDDAKQSSTKEEVIINEDLVQHIDFEQSQPSDTVVGGTNSQYPATLVGNNVEIVENADDIFGNVAKFGKGNDSYIKISDSINTAKHDYTFSLWSKYDNQISETNPSASAIVLQQNKDGRTLLDIKSDGHLNTYVYAENVDSQGIVQKDKWQHLALSVNHNDNTGVFYIDGQLDSTVNLGQRKVDQLTDLFIGAHKNFGDNPHQFRGLLDDISIYQRVLSADEIQGIYQQKGVKLFERDNWQPLVKEAEKLLKEEGDLVQNKPEFDRLQSILSAVKSTSTSDLSILKGNYDSLKQAITAYRQMLPVDISIDVDKVQRMIDAKHIFGINHRYAFNGYGSFDEQTGKVREEFTELYKKAGFGSIRYPGGTISNLFNWKTAIGPMSERKKQIHGFYNNPNQEGIAPNFGLSEIATFAKEADSEMVYVYSLGRGNAQDIADLMEFLNAEVGTNPNGGVDWAQVRSDLGHQEAFNIKFFEIGNEMNQGNAAGEGTVSQTYWTAFVKGKTTEQAYTEGGTAIFKEQYAVAEENWNKQAARSDGRPNLVRYMRYANTNPKKYVDGNIINDSQFVAVDKSSVRVFVSDKKGKEEWRIVDDFANSQSDDKHVVVDYSTGALYFGDGRHGKIPEKHKLILVSYSVKRDGFVQIAQQLKATMQQIARVENKKKQAYVFGGYESDKFIKHMARIGKNDLYDGLTIHPYSGHVNGGKNTDKFYDNAMLKAENAAVHHVEKYVKLLPQGKVPVISEFGIFRNTEPQVRSLTHALYIGKTLMSYVKLGSPYIQKHALVDWYSSGADSLGPTQQAVIQAVAQPGASTKTGQGNFKYFATPSAHVFEMLNKGFGNYILSSQISRMPKLSNHVEAISTLASKDDDGNIYIALINVDREQDYQLHLAIPNIRLNGRLVEVQTLTSDNVTDENELDSPNKVHIQRSQFVYQDNHPYTIQRHSFVLLKIQAPIVNPHHSSELSSSLQVVDKGVIVPPFVTPVVKPMTSKTTVASNQLVNSKIVKQKKRRSPIFNTISKPKYRKRVALNFNKVSMVASSAVVRQQAPLGKVVKQLPATGKVNSNKTVTVGGVILTVLSVLGLSKYKHH